MKKKWLSLTVLVLAAVNTAVSVSVMSGMKHTTARLLEKQKDIIALEKTLYDIPSLDSTIALLQKNAAEQRAFHEASSGFDPLKLTGDILHLFKKNNITVERYQIQGAENTKELFIQGKGITADITALLYALSFSGTGFRINFLSVDTGGKETPAILVMRVTYA